VTLRGNSGRRLQEPITNIIDAVTQTLEQAEPELAADLVDNGITDGRRQQPSSAASRSSSPNATGLDVRLAEDPLTCVARGTSGLPGKPGAVERHDGE